MGDWSEACVGMEASIADAIAAIDASSTGIALVVDGDGRLVGVVTDGDVRRGLLTGRELNERLDTILNTAPRTARQDASRGVLLGVMRAHGIHQLPLVDDADRVVGLTTIDALVGAEARPNTVVIMAGGEGRRLRPLTDDTPKPLLPVGGQPMLNWVISTLAGHGYRHIFVSVNFQAEKIRTYVGDGSRWGVDVRYLDETEPLGTAGSLALLPKPQDHPLLVVNADVLTDVDLGALVDFHSAAEAFITIAVRDHDTTVPFGVLEVDPKGTVLALEEKPVLAHTISAGIYVLSPQAIELVPGGVRTDMTDVLQTAIAARQPVRAVNVSDSWIDIGRHEQLAEARDRFPVRDA